MSAAGVSQIPSKVLIEPGSALPAIAVIGNPNTGKSTLFNALTGLRQHIGNYPGVTVERKTGIFQLDSENSVELIDLPGTYSLAARSPDEMIAVDVLLGQQQGAKPVDAILAIGDASNPERNFYLISQLCELGLPVVIALNMLDVAENKGIQIDCKKLSELLGTPVVGICANKGKGLPELKQALLKVLDEKKSPTGSLPQFPEPMLAEIEALRTDLHSKSKKLGREVNRLEVFRALVDKGGHAETRLAQALGSDFKKQLEIHRQKASKIPLPAEEVRVRYGWVKQTLASAIRRPAQPPATRSDTIDKWVTHWFSGTLIFVALMFLIFQSIFKWSKPAMELISSSFDTAGTFVNSVMADGPLRNLLSVGVIKGVGAVLVFLPQICLLFFFIAIMEDCGYMARAAFLMDRLLSRVGLSGKSFIPMLSSFACAVPGIMATRTIENWRDRLTTIFVAPLMSCSARLPVYGLMIYTFIPEQGYLGGWLGLRGLTLFAMYWVGLLTAVPVAWILKKTLLKGETPPFLIELPSYKIPDWRGVLMRVYDRAKAFVWRAGTIILAVNIVVWALAYFPHPAEISERHKARRVELKQQTELAVAKAAAPQTPESLTRDKSSPLARVLAQAEIYDKQRDEELAKISDQAENEKAENEKKIEDTHGALIAELAKTVPMYWPAAVEIRNVRKELDDGLAEIEKQETGDYLRQSYFGRMGQTVEPVFKPLGWDWRISMAALASFPAREVIVATLGSIFNQGSDQNEESQGLKDALKESTWDGSNRKLFNIPVALSIMVFFALCSQCAATLATIRRETNSWRWPLFSFSYMTILAYIGAALVYQIGMRM